MAIEPGPAQQSAGTVGSAAGYRCPGFTWVSAFAAASGGLAGEGVLLLALAGGLHRIPGTDCFLPVK